jgi:selenocysteine lyase/cysteine desulfurase
VRSAREAKRKLSRSWPRPEDGELDGRHPGCDRRRTALVCTPMSTGCAAVIDVEAIARRCRSVGAVLALDTTQSTGRLPIDRGRGGSGLSGRRLL